MRNEDASRIRDLLDVPPRPAPWAEGDNIPGQEPAFSKRMLLEHLSQSHDLASRRHTTIDAPVDWIHQNVLREQTGSILDLGCGPGFYTSRLARLGHRCMGSTTPRRRSRTRGRKAESEDLARRYLHGDLRAAEFGSGHDLALLIFWELNVFSPGHVRQILGRRTVRSPRAGSSCSNHIHLRRCRSSGRARHRGGSSPEGSSRTRPTSTLEESFSDPDTATATRRYILVDSGSAAVSHFAQTMQAYSEVAYEALLAEAGFEDIRFLSSLTGEAEEEQAGLFALRAVRGSGD